MKHSKLSWLRNAVLVYLAAGLSIISLPRVASSATTVTVYGSPATLGLPGDVVGWGLRVSADPGVYPLLTSALPGTSVTGTLQRFRDEYRVSPGDPGFNPQLGLSNPGQSAFLSVSVAVGSPQAPLGTYSRRWNP